jgi:hypothetical protein
MEYRRGRQLADEWLRKLTPENVYREMVALRRAGRSEAEELLPLSTMRWQREAWMQALEKFPTEGHLDFLVRQHPELRVLKDPEVQQKLRARARWAGRKEFFGQFAALTGDRRGLSLLHPFDDLNAAQMKQAIQAASLAIDKGLGALTAEQRWLLLTAGQLDFFDRLLERVE